MRITRINKIIVKLPMRTNRHMIAAKLIKDSQILPVVIY